MKRSLPFLLALAGLAACDATASNQPATLVVTLTPSSANSSCVVATPDPASIRAGQTIAFRNETSRTHTIIADARFQSWQRGG